MDNELRGALFKNQKKTDERHPDYRGEVTVEGVKYEIGAWLKTSANGLRYMSMKLQLPREQAAPAQAKKSASAATNFDDMEDDIPF